MNTVLIQKIESRNLTLKEKIKQQNEILKFVTPY
jgi:hypothetical protein